MEKKTMTTNNAVKMNYHPEVSQILSCIGRVGLVHFLQHAARAVELMADVEPEKVYQNELVNIQTNLDILADELEFSNLIEEAENNN